MSRLLDRVNEPTDLRDLDLADLDRLAEEIRAVIVETVGKTGGHLAANLGVVELTLGLLKVFEPPIDQVLWDVSHQGYAYKILTGRKDRFHTLRQRGGISGFLRRDESDCDAFGSGHSGTALSAALGMAVARDQRGSDEHVVAVLGDGSAGNGISLEALNNVAQTTRRMVVVLNDNEMSIAANVGAISRYLGRLLASPQYNRRKRALERFAQKLHMGWLRSAYYRTEEFIKGLFLRSIVFEEFGLRYIGPINGHDIRAVIDAMTIARNSDRPILVHVSTQKGKGYALAEKHPEKWHGTSPFNPETGEALTTGSSPTYSEVFGKTLERQAALDARIVAITAAMPAGTGLSGFSKRFPERFFDVGISEEHAVVFAAGMAARGLIPVFAVYSTFCQRAVDCIIHDVCLQNLAVILCLDRAGVVGDDGPTHHGVFDIPLLRPIPNLVIMQPKDEPELASMLYTAVLMGRPVVIRYPRGCGRGLLADGTPDELPLGKAEVILDGGGTPVVQIWALGDMLSCGERAAEELQKRGIETGVVNVRFIKPLDEALLKEQAATAGVFVTLENGVIAGGLGEGIESVLRKAGFRGEVCRFGWPDEFVPHGSTDALMQEYGLTADAVTAAVAGAVTRHGKGSS